MRWLVAFFLLIAKVAAFGDDSIGKVIVVEGEASATNSVQGTRVLQRGSSIYVADTIVVGSDSKAQIKFSDGGLLNLIPDTEFRVNEYRYKKLFKKDRFSSELVQGGFRSMSGSIAKKNPDEYEIKTPTSTIGIRGTVIEARIVEGVVYVGCESGQAFVKNEAGSALIGRDAPTQYVAVPSRAATPQPTAQRPSTLQPSLFVEPKGGVNIAREQAKTDTAVNRSPTATSSGGGEGSAAAGSSGTGTSTESSAAQTETSPSGGEGSAATSTSADSSGQTTTTETGDFSQTDPAFQSSGSSVSISGGC